MRGAPPPSGGNNDHDDNLGGDMPSWMFKEVSNRGKTNTRDSKKKPDQILKNDNHATQDVQKTLQKENVFAGPCLTRAEAKKIQPLKVKEAMSSVNKTTIEDLKKKNSNLKKCFDRVGKPIIRENYVGEFFMTNGLLYQKHQEMKTGRSSTSWLYLRDFDNRLCL